MLWNLLTDLSSSVVDGSSGSSSPAGHWTDSLPTYIMLGVAVVAIIVMMVYQRRSQKKRQEETQKTLDALKPGNTVKTIGGICGTVVEVCDDNTFVLETGSDKSGKSYMRFDKQAIYQTDAVAKEEAPKAETQATTETVAKEPFEETAKEEAPVEEKTEE